MKKLAIPFVILIAVLVVPPYFIGSQAEDTVREMYQKASKNPTLDFEVTEYNRGWFSSDVKITLKLATAAVQQNDDFSMVITQNMQHGFILWKTGGLGFGLADIQYGIETSDKFQAELDKIEGLKGDEITALSRLAFDGSSESIMRIADFTVSEKDKKINVKSGEFKTSIVMNEKMTFSGEWNGMTVNESDKQIVEIGALTLDMDQKLIEGDMFSPSALFEGDMSMVLSAINVTGNSPAERVNIEGFMIKTSQLFKQDLANVDVLFAIEKLSAMGQQFDDLAYDLSFENIDKATLLAVNQLMMEGEAADPAMMSQKFQALLPNLIAKNPLVKINRIGTKTPVGEIKTTAQISINSDLYDEKNFMSLMSAVEVVANGYAPEKFFAGFGMAADIDMLVQQNMLVRENDQVKFDLSFKNGQATLNGAPVPLGM